MIRWSVVAVALVLASSVQAMPLASLQTPTDVVIKVREACGAGMQVCGCWQQIDSIERSRDNAQRKGRPRIGR